MNLVFQKTRELGAALLASDEYLQMKAAEEAARDDNQAMAAMTEHTLHRKLLEKLMETENPDMDALQTHSEALESVEERLALMDSMNELNEKRQAFGMLVGQINQVLRFIITGEMGDDEEDDGFPHNCGKCGGCRKLH